MVPAALHRPESVCVGAVVGDVALRVALGQEWNDETVTAVTVVPLGSALKRAWQSSLDLIAGWLVVAKGRVCFERKSEESRTDEREHAPHLLPRCMQDTCCERAPCPTAGHCRPRPRGVQRSKRRARSGLSVGGGGGAERRMSWHSRRTEPQPTAVCLSSLARCLAINVRCRTAFGGASGQPHWTSVACRIWRQDGDGLAFGALGPE